jgi:hypothetical protein
MTSIIKNPQIEFIEKGDMIINLPDFELSYLVQDPLKKSTKEELLQLNEDGFKTASFPQLVQLLYSTSVTAYRHNEFQEIGRIIGMSINQLFGIDDREKAGEIEFAKYIINHLESGWLIANTGTLFNQDGLYIQDFPQVKNGEIKIDPYEIKDQLISDENHVHFNEDRTMRFVPKKILSGKYFKKPYLLGLTGSEINQEMFLKYMTRLSQSSITQPYLCPNKKENPITTPTIIFDKNIYWKLLSTNLYDVGKHAHSVLVKEIK